MEDIKQLSYDLDTVYNEAFLSCEPSVNLAVPFPSKDQVAQANRVLTNQIAALVKRSTDISVHYDRMIKWWNEYESLVQTVQGWVQDGEEKLSQLTARAGSDSSPRENPTNLLNEAQVCIKNLMS